MVYYHMLAHCLYLWYTTTFYWPTAYIYGTLLPSTGLLLIPMVPNYLRLAHILSLWCSTAFYWLLSIPVVLCIFYWITDCTSVTLLPSSGSLLIPMVLYYLLLAHYLFLCTAYTFGTLLPSTGSLPILMVIYCHLLALCLYL